MITERASISCWARTSRANRMFSAVLVARVFRQYGLRRYTVLNGVLPVMDRLPTGESVNGGGRIGARKDDVRKHRLAEQIHSDHRDAEIVATESDPDIARAQDMVHVVVFPQRLHVHAEVVSDHRLGQRRSLSLGSRVGWSAHPDRAATTITVACPLPAPSPAGGPGSAQTSSSAAPNQSSRRTVPPKPRGHMGAGRAPGAPGIFERQRDYLIKTVELAGCGEAT